MISGFLINLACSNVSPTYNDACHKSVTAFSIQSGADGTFSLIENKTREQARAVATYYLGDTTLRVGGLVYGLYHSVQTRTVGFDIPNFGICNSIHTDLNPSSGTLKFNWKF